jgi:hypothetical protein
MAIAKDFGWFLAALMKKDFSKTTGIDYIAVGGSKPGGVAKDSDFSEESFEIRARSFFEKYPDEKAIQNSSIFWAENYKDVWIWAMPLEGGKIDYYDDPLSNLRGNDGQKGKELKTTEVGNPRYKHIRNQIRIAASFGNTKPFNDQILELREFALLAIDTENGKFLKDKLFFISYDKHPVITKSQDMTITRNAILSFPSGQI